MSRMTYLKSAVFPKDYPEADRPEIIVTGRSNAGKSSFLNALAKAKVAHVSQMPGKTKLLSFFDFAKYRFVDSPGYGFAARSGDEIVQWTGMIEAYLSSRENLAGLILLMDIRREWDEDEMMLKKFCGAQNIPLLLVLTKSDKCSRGEIEKLKTKLKNKAQVPTQVISSQEKTGIEELEEFVFKNWVLPMLNAPVVKEPQ